MAVVWSTMDDELKGASKGAGGGTSRSSSNLLIVGGALVIALAAFLPWLRTGSVWRSSFGLVRGLELVGFVHGTTARLLDLWYLAPAVVAGIWLAAFTGRRRLLVALAVVLAVGAMILALVVLVAPVSTGIGPLVTLLGSALVAAGIVVLALHRGVRNERFTRA
jgi:hypothetical protein